MSRRDYSIYTPNEGITDAWGLTVTSIGHTNIKPNTPYPSGGHPKDHALSWERGRVLDAYQIVYISKGSGEFESKGVRKQRIDAGTVFILFPKVWHRYRPHLKTGWVEDWVEIAGEAANRLFRKGVISPRRPIYQVGLRPAVLELFDQCHETALEQGYVARPVLAVLCLQILAQIASSDSASLARRSGDVDPAILKAMTIIGEQFDRPLAMESVAEAVGAGYSYFRRAFKRYTGLTPKQYQLRLRLRRAQQLLASSSMSIQEIADALGFDSAFHLSADFKLRTGQSPTLWRNAHMQNPAEQTE
jgi:AraC-like DNA-binding protein